MLPTQGSSQLMEILKGKNREITLEIQLVTAWIQEHRAIRPDCVEAPSLSHERAVLQSWRKVSYRLHQRRSELKIKLENIRMHLRAAAHTTEKTETDFLYFPFLLDMELESEPASAGA